jgi:hypothetical protein
MSSHAFHFIHRAPYSWHQKSSPWFCLCTVGTKLCKCNLNKCQFPCVLTVLSVFTCYACTIIIHNNCHSYTYGLCSRIKANFLRTSIIKRLPVSNIALGSGIAQRHSDGLRAEWSGIRVPARAGNFYFHYRVQTGSGAHQASYQMDTLGVKQPGREADHSPPSIAEVKEYVEL